MTNLICFNKKNQNELANENLKPLPRKNSKSAISHSDTRTKVQLGVQPQKDINNGLGVSL